MNPDKATKLLETVCDNRPVSMLHVGFLASQMREGKWIENGDMIRVDTEGVLSDGQHRLWALIESNMTMPMWVAYNVPRDAFPTIDAGRVRAKSDMIALSGRKRHRRSIGEALTWLLRYERGVLLNYKAAENRIDNTDIKRAFAEHPHIVDAIEQASRLRRLRFVSIIGFVYYTLVNRNPEIAERLIETLENPIKAAVNDPFYLLRDYFTNDHLLKKDPIVTIALAFKAANAAAQGRKLSKLMWKSHGKGAEAFPELEVGK